MSFRAHLPERIPPGAWLVIGAALLWYAPTIALHRVQSVAARVRFAAVMVCVEVLFALRRDRAARNLLAATIRRNRRHLRAARVRAGRSRR